MVKFRLISTLLLVPFIKPETTLLPVALTELSTAGVGATPSRT